MKPTLVTAIVLFLTPWVCQSQDQGVTLDDLIESAQQWATNNLDENVLKQLQGVDQDQVNRLFADLRKQFHGTYVINLSSLKEPAKLALPLLERYEETLPYGIWLRTRLDYLDVAEEFRLTIPPPKEEPGKPPPPLPNPAPQAEREVWIKKLAERPWPAAAKRYVDKLKPIFVAAKVPPELVWIAEVESSFDPRARSPMGASGMFQLMPATARQYGVSLHPFDRRLQPEDSARAAAQYLKTLHTRFKDWQLALAAYNAGEGTVQGILDKRKATSFDAISSRLPAETQLYVPKVEAVLLRREGRKLSQLRIPTS